jgi:hypothetical protein
MKSYPIKNTKQNIGMLDLERNMTQHSFREEENDNIEEFDRGMPARTTFKVKKQLLNEHNNHNDFDLFDKIDTKTAKILHNETMSQDGEFADLYNEQNLITKENNTFETCINDVSSTTCWMNSIYYNLNKKTFVVNGFGLFMGFGTLYMCSDNKTKSSLKEFFSFQNPKFLNAGLLTLREKNNNVRSQITMDNYLLSDKSLNVNIENMSNLKSLIFSIVINNEYIDEETKRVNNIIRSISNIENIISKNTLSKSNLSLITIAKINPIWNHKIDSVTKNYHNNELIKFINFNNKKFDYYENKEKAIIEIPMMDKSFVVGLINYKNNNKDNFTNFDELSFCINYLKNQTITLVSIPTINQRFKTRMNTILINNGLNNIFDNCSIKKLFNTNNLDDCLQYVDICFGTKCTNKTSKNDSSGTKSFVISKNFEFYIRNIEHNCVIMMGYL